MIDAGVCTREEYEKEFEEEWNRLFPNGFDTSMQQIRQIVKEHGQYEKWQAVIGPAMKILEEGFNERKIDNL
jgi:hypothetical protein